MNRLHFLTIILALALAPLPLCGATPPLEELRHAAGDAAPAVPAVGDDKAVSNPLPELPPSDGMWWQKGGFDLKALEALAARAEATLAKLPQALERESADGTPLVAEIQALAAAYDQVGDWHFPYGGDFHRYGMSCVRQGPWSDQIWYVTEYWQGPHWVEMDAIKEDLSVFESSLKAIADHAKESLKTPGLISGKKTPTAALLEKAIARVRDAELSFLPTVRKVHAEGMTQVTRKWTEDSRYRPRDGEQPPVSKSDCPHNGVY